MSEGKQITVAMIDDHDLVRNRTCEFFEDFGFKVLFKAENGRVAIEQLEAGLIPDVCVVDVNMPVMNGVETAKEMSRKFPQVKILAYSMNSDEKSISDMLQSCAAGYLAKDGNPYELRNAIETLYRGEKYLLNKKY